MNLLLNHPLRDNPALGFHQIHLGLEEIHLAFHFILLSLDDFPTDFDLITKVFVLFLRDVGNVLLIVLLGFVDISYFLKILCILAFVFADEVITVLNISNVFLR